ncbi:GNAT family N-acetyltransferase [Anaeroselena agilis]|uniref:GNAT family N-acetyltransferase n=1 Tax=Anaeroselena agilis TaxID=3063788 RepID=A0ABU3P664_9FIRM|nr:GNAT family N-acetyltransferase [Selenomonadales bacterium 4137-cl]
MTDIDFVTMNDTEAWLALAREVEPLFGPMAGEAGFIQAVEEIIAARKAYCVRDREGLAGGVAVSGNAIEWLAVAARARGKGYGRALLAFALEKCDPALAVTVQTFDASCPEGAAARQLYTDAGFVETEKAGPNPAGVGTVMMRRSSAGKGDRGGVGQTRCPAGRHEEKPGVRK